MNCSDIVPYCTSCSMSNGNVVCNTCNTTFNANIQVSNGMCVITGTVTPSSNNVYVNVINGNSVLVNCPSNCNNCTKSNSNSILSAPTCL